MASRNRPVYLNLFKIRLPVTGIISIFHRITGVLLFLFIPVSLHYLQVSVADRAHFEQLAELMKEPVSRFIILLFIWSFVHHLLTGIRFLLIDLDLFLERKSARQSAWGVVAIEMIIMAAIIFGVFL